MADITTTGSEYLLRLQQRLDNAGLNFGDYYTLLSLAGQQWGNTATYDPNNFYQITFRSTEQSQVGARQYVSNGGLGITLIANISTSSNDKMVFTARENLPNIPQNSTIGYTASANKQYNLIWKDAGEPGNAADDVYVRHDKYLRENYTANKTTSGFADGHVTRIDNSTDTMAFSSSQYFFSATLIKNAEQRWSGLYVPAFTDGYYEFERGTILKYNFVDRIDPFQMSWDRLTFDSLRDDRTSTETFTVGFTNLKAVTDTYTMSGSMASRPLTLDENLAFDLSDADIFPESGSLEQIKTVYYTALEAVFLSANNVITVSRQEGLSFNAGAGNDKLTGNIGDDVLSGGSGNDTLFGGNGDDILSGDSGVDRLTGGSGADVFRFSLGTDFVTTGRRDVITDFTKGEDLISLVGIDANTSLLNTQNFTFSATPPANNAATGIVWVTLQGGSQYLVNMSTNSNSLAELQIQVNLVGTDLTALTASDFILT